MGGVSRRRQNRHGAETISKADKTGGKKGMLSSLLLEPCFLLLSILLWLLSHNTGLYRRVERQ